MSNRSIGISPAASLILASAFWAIGTVISKTVLASVPPITFLVAQLAPSVLALWLIVFATGVQPPAKHALVPITLLGCLNPGLSYTFSILGLAQTTASVASLLWAAEPAFIIVMVWLLLRERISVRLVATTATAACGVLFVSGIATDTRATGDGLGNGLVLAGVTCCALYTVLFRKIGTSADPLFVVALQQTAGLIWAAAMWPVQSFLVVEPPIAALSVNEWIGATVSGLMYYAAAFWFYLIGLRSLPASVAGVFLNLIPLFAIVAAYLALDERLDLSQWIGAAVILMSVSALLIWKRSSGTNPTD
jgi:drug/metabolite transporter (DMT)-like permease